MGSRFATDNHNKVIHAPWWEKGETVTIRKLTWWDHTEIESAMLQIGMDVEGGDSAPSTSMNFSAQKSEQMRRGIHSWNFKSEAGEVMPATLESFRKLEYEDAEFILKEIEKFNITTRVSKKMIKKSQARAANSAAFLNNLVLEEANPTQIELARNQLEAAEERHEEMEALFKEQQATFQETGESAQGDKELSD